MREVRAVRMYRIMVIIFSSENLSRRKTTVLSQSSTYTDRYASYANDGDLQTHIEFCAHTAPGHHLAWFQVDLGQEYSIKSVKIYYRREGTVDEYTYLELYITHSPTLPRISVWIV